MKPYGSKEYPNVHRPIVELFGKSIGGNASLQPKWDIPQKVVIKCAVVGTIWDRDSNPHQPYSIQEIVDESSACIDAGATSLHLHVRDNEGNHTVERKYFEEVVLPLRKKYGHRIHLDGESVFGETFDDSLMPITSGLFESSYVNTTATYVGDTLICMPPSFMVAQAETIQKHKAKAIIAVYNPGDIDNAERYLIRPGVIKTPAEWIVIPGLPGCAGVPNPMAMCEVLLSFVNRIKEIDPQAVIMVCGGGRASSYLTTLGILLGLHVRIGMEDTVWRHPHRDRLLTSNREVVEETVQLARMLGREPAGADDYRKLVGLR